MASGNTLLIFSPLSNEPPSLNFATFDSRNQHPCLDFDDTVNEDAVFSSVMPQHYSGGGVTVYLHFAMSSAIIGNVDWDAAFERIGDQQQDLDVDGFAAPQSSIDNVVPGVSGNVSIIAIPFADGVQMDGILAGESFRIKATRIAVNDSAAGDAELVKVEIRET